MFFFSVSYVSNAGRVESCPSSPLFIPAKPEKKSVRRARKDTKDSGGGSTDSEDHVAAGIKETSVKKRHKGPTNQKESKGKTVPKTRAEEGQESQDAEVTQRSTVTEKGQDQETPAKQEQKQQKTAGEVTAAPQTEEQQQQPNKTSKDLGEQCFTHFIWFQSCQRRWKNMWQCE